ncbi:MAG: hypothetical protein MJA83_10315 [Gammaproteobacteria bacterium]|nr:hypothetical protein [Gammaproteobacteria bacterium]
MNRDERRKKFGVDFEFSDNGILEVSFIGRSGKTATENAYRYIEHLEQENAELQDDLKEAAEQQRNYIARVSELEQKLKECETEMLEWRESYYNLREAAEES